MELTKIQFDILSDLAVSGESAAPGRPEAVRGYDHSAIDTAIRELSDRGFLDEGEITKAGLAVLEPYRVRRAVFLAAGFGSRMLPVTLNTPKPLVPVHGRRIIDTLIDACIDNGIDEIYIVRGYLADRFDQLLDKYPMIKFLENPLYRKENNISSVIAAKDMLQNAYVLEADLLLSNPAIITRYHYTSDVLGIYKEHTDDWVLDVDRDGFVCDERIGGSNTYQMVGIYYLDSADGQRLSEHLDIAYNAPGGRDLYWETVPNLAYKGQYRISLRPCSDEDIVEIDTFEELRAIDSSYDV